jgi:chorismate dehydratase
MNSHIAPPITLQNQPHSNAHSTLIIGRIPFLVCCPFFYNTLTTPIPNVCFTDGSPKEQNTRLFNGTIDAAPSSSFEYGKHPELYYLSPSICTGSTLEIQSVLLFSHVAIDSLHKATIHLSSQSDTSNHLLQILLSQYYNITNCTFVYNTTNTPHQAQLLIGDDALSLQSSLHHYEYVYDLASVWYEWTNLPFVFGTWIFRKDSWAHKQETIITYHQQLQNDITNFIAHPKPAIQQWQKAYPSTIPHDSLQKYYNTLDYNFSQAHQKSLLLYFYYCKQMNFIHNAPDKLDFLPIA